MSVLSSVALPSVWCWATFSPIAAIITAIPIIHILVIPDITATAITIIIRDARITDPTGMPVMVATGILKSTTLADTRHTHTPPGITAGARWSPPLGCATRIRSTDPKTDL